MMKDKELQVEETEASHTLGGPGEGRVQVRGYNTYVVPVCMTEKRNTTCTESCNVVLL